MIFFNLDQRTSRWSNVVVIFGTTHPRVVENASFKYVLRLQFTAVCRARGELRASLLPRPSSTHFQAGAAPPIQQQPHLGLQWHPPAGGRTTVSQLFCLPPFLTTSSSQLSNFTISASAILLRNRTNKCCFQSIVPYGTPRNWKEWHKIYIIHDYHVEGAAGENFAISAFLK